MEKQEAFVIGDVHGMEHLLDELLLNWDANCEQLIFVGDLIDRGPNSYNVIQKVRKLQTQHQAICLRGNHEAMLWEVLTRPEEFFLRYRRNGGLTTISELLNRSEKSLEILSGEKIAEMLHAEHPWLKTWIESLPVYIEFGNFIIVHAGVDLEIPHWQDSTERDFVWIREPFHKAPNRTGRQIIFGHTPVMALHEDIRSTDVWHRDGKWGIDGGAVYGGVLHGIHINQQTVLKIDTVRS